MRCGCGCRSAPHPHPQLPPGPARRALVGSPGAPLALSHTCTVAGQQGQSCNTSAARPRTVFPCPSCSKSLLGSCRGMPFVFPPHTLPYPQPPAQRSPARPALGSVGWATRDLRPIFSAPSFWGSHPPGSWDFCLRQGGGAGKVGKERTQGR